MHAFLYLDYHCIFYMLQQEMLIKKRSNSQQFSAEMNGMLGKHQTTSVPFMISDQDAGYQLLKTKPLPYY